MAAPQVQEAACSALATAIENAGAARASALLTPRLPAIVANLAAALAHYSRKPLRLAYEALTATAEATGEALLQPDLVNRFMPVRRRL